MARNSASSRTTGVSPKQRKQQFWGSRVHHPQLNEVIRELCRLIWHVREGRMIILVGPVGVGKSIACASLVDSLIAEHFERLPDDLQTVPAIMEAEAPRKHKPFDWGRLNRSLLQAPQVPLSDDTLPVVKREIHGRYISVPSSHSRVQPTAETLEDRFCLALKQRNPETIFIDEASNILPGRKAREVKDQANVLKRPGYRPFFRRECSRFLRAHRHIEDVSNLLAMCGAAERGSAHGHLLLPADFCA